MRTPLVTVFLRVAVCLAMVFLSGQGRAALAQSGPAAVQTSPSQTPMEAQPAAPTARERRELVHAAEEIKTWQTILAGIEKDLDLRIRQTETLRRILPAMKAELGDALAKADNRLDQLMLLRGVAGDTPWAFRSILIQLRELGRYVELKRSPLDDRQARLAQAKKDYSSIRAIRKKGLTMEYAIGTSDSLDAPVARFREFKKDLDEVKADVDAALSQSSQLQADIAQVHDQIQNGFIDALRQYYFSRSDPLLTLEGWQSLCDDLEEWTEAFPRFVGPLVEWVRWSSFFSYLAGVFVLLCLAAGGLNALRRKDIRSGGMSLEADTETPLATKQATEQVTVQETDGLHGEAEAATTELPAPPPGPNSGPNSGPVALQRAGRVLLFLGVSIFFADQLTLFTNNQFVALGWVLLMTFGIMLRLSPFMSPGQVPAALPFVRRPIFVFSVLFALGVVLQALNAPASFIGLAWSLAALWASIRLYRLRVQAGNASRLRNIAAQAGYLMALMVLAGLAGFGPQCLILTQSIFSLPVTLGLSRVLRPSVTALAGKRGGGAGVGLGRRGERRRGGRGGGR